jgi:tetratricopeptide (TPR) repeat protein
LDASAQTSKILASIVRQAKSNPSQALRLASAATRKNPACYPCHYNEGVLLERMGKADLAKAAYRKVLELKPTHLATLINLSNLFLRSGLIKKSRSVITAAIRKAPNSIGLRNQLTAILLEEGRYDDAAAQAKGVLKNDERNANAMIHLALVFYHKKKYELAERILLKAGGIDKTNPMVPLRLGFIYLKQGNPKTAIAQFKESLKLDPKSEVARINLGVLFSQAHDYKSAIEQFRQAVAKAPMFTEAYLDLGNALRGDLQYKEAEAAYKKVLAINSKESRAVFNLGLLYLDDNVPGYDKIKRYGLAVEYLQKYQRGGGRHAKLAKYMAEAKKKQERAIKAKERREKRERDKQQREIEKKKKEEEEARSKAAEESKRKKSGSDPVSSAKIGGVKDDEPTSEKKQKGKKDPVKKETKKGERDMGKKIGSGEK